MYETFDHTADLGLRVRAASLNQLFSEAGEALFASIVEEVQSILPQEHFEIEIAGEDREYLFFDWLRELLYRFDAEHWLFCQFRVEVHEKGLKASVAGEVLDPERHLLSHEVKAITYHGLRVETCEEGWLAEVIIDI